MSLARIQSCAFVGLEALAVDVEADTKKEEKGFFLIVGLPDTAVKESKDRVLTALKNSHFKCDGWQCTLNLAPADLKKEGALYDLPIALALLLSQGIIKQANQHDYLTVGELSLSGETRPMRGALPATLLARKMGKRGIILPKANYEEAQAVPDIEIIGVETLLEAVEFLKNPSSYAPPKSSSSQKSQSKSTTLDLAEIKGQLHVKRALEIAAAGGHNLLFYGPPGTGKTLIAKAMAGILPPLSLEEALEVTQIHSLAGLLQEGGLVEKRPFRNPHHTISAVGMVGGGKMPRPGELSLSHRGVLFLDELPEFSRYTLEVLRQPLENGVVTVSRASASVTFPTQCLLIAAMNPCPCGFLGHPQKPCKDTPSQIQRYRSKISGPLLDRIDMHIAVSPLSFDEMQLGKEKSESSETVQARVILAREKQKERYRSIKCNAHISPQELQEHCQLQKSSLSLMRQAMDSLSLSARAYHRVLKVARTIADLASLPHIEEEHLMEALSYRSWDG